MFQTSESCIKLHAVVVLELLLSEQCVCVCPLLQVCVLGWVKCREHISLLVILCIIVYVTNKKKKIYIGYRFFSKLISDYGKMLKYREEYR